MLAVYLATEPAHEVEARLVDLELARAVPRHVLITRSLTMAAAAILLATVLMASGTWLGLRTLASPMHTAPTPRILGTLLLHVAAVAAVCATLGLAIAAGAKRWSTAFLAAALAAAVLYLVDFLSIGWPVMRAVSWVSPFHYFPALAILAGDAPVARNLAILLSAAVALTLLAYWRFSRRDL